MNVGVTKKHDPPHQHANAQKGEDTQQTLGVPKNRPAKRKNEHSERREVGCARQRRTYKCCDDRDGTHPPWACFRDSPY
jgi:hypothetical protein